MRGTRGVEIGFELEDRGGGWPFDRGCEEDEHGEPEGSVSADIRLDAARKGPTAGEMRPDMAAVHGDSESFVSP